MSVNSAWCRAALATVTALALVFGSTQAPALAVDNSTESDIEVLGFSATLVLDGQEYTVVDGKVVPATKETRKPAGPSAVEREGKGYIVLPDDPADAADDERIPLPPFVTEGSASAAAARQIGSTFPPSGFHTFTRAKPYWGFSDYKGSGAEQQKYANNRTMWGYRLSPTIQKIVAGSITHQHADRYHDNTIKHYGDHFNVPPDYWFHGSSGGIESRGTYATTFRAEFRHNIGNGGNAVLSAQWNWQRR